MTAEACQMMALMRSLWSPSDATMSFNLSLEFTKFCTLNFPFAKFLKTNKCFYDSWLQKEPFSWQINLHI